MKSLALGMLYGVFSGALSGAILGTISGTFVGHLSEPKYKELKWFWHFWGLPFGSIPGTLFGSFLVALLVPFHLYSVLPFELSN